MDSETRKECLILTAIEIIDDLGYQGLTTKELSKRQNITEAAMYKHFKNKNELINHVLDYYNNFFNKIYESKEIENMTALEAVEFYISKSLEFYEKHPAMTAILNSYETFRHEEKLSNSVSKYCKVRLAFLTKLFQKGIDNHELNGMLSAESLAYITIGTMTSVSLHWRMQNYEFSLTDKINLITNQMKAKIIR